MGVLLDRVWHAEQAEYLDWIGLGIFQFGFIFREFDSSRDGRPIDLETHGPHVVMKYGFDCALMECTLPYDLAH